MVEPARTCNDRLLRGEPLMRPDPIDDYRRRLDIRSLHIDRTHSELLVSQESFEFSYAVMLDQIGMAIHLANQVCLVAAGIEITMPDLAVIIRTNRIVALADV